MKTPSQQLKESLREEWLKVCEDDRENRDVTEGCWECGVKIYPQGVADWWLKKFEAHTIKLLQAEIERLEGMKRERDLSPDDYGDSPNAPIRNYEYQVKGYNQALQDQISHLKEQITKIK